MYQILTNRRRGFYGNDFYTKLLLHCDGADGSTKFLDSSLSNHTVTAIGDAQIDTAQKKFGAGSALFDGAGDYLSISDSNNWYMGTGEFTIDMWVRFNDITAIMGLFQQYVDNQNYVKCHWDQTQTKLYFKIEDNNVTTVSMNADWTPVVNTWYFVEIVRGWAENANGWSMSINGISVATVTDVDPWPDLASSIEIGNSTIAGSDYEFNGWIDEVRVSKGIARHTANFTPPNRPYR